MTRARQPAGTPTGGQFARETRPAAGIRLDDAEGTKEATIDTVLAAIAQAVPGGGGIEDVSLTDGGCGLPEGMSYVGARFPGHGQDFRTGFLVSEAGGVREMMLESAWGDPDGDPGARGYTRKTITDVPGAQTTQTAQGLVEDVRGFGRVQRALDDWVRAPQFAQFNDRDRQARQHDILHMHVMATGLGYAPQIVVEDRRTSRSQQLRLDVTDTGQITGGILASTYGDMRLDGNNLDRAAASLSREVMLARDEFDRLGEASKAELQGRLADVMAAAARDELDPPGRSVQ